MRNPESVPFNGLESNGGGENIHFPESNGSEINEIGETKTLTISQTTRLAVGNETGEKVSADIQAPTDSIPRDDGAAPLTRTTVKTVSSVAHPQADHEYRNEESVNSVNQTVVEVKNPTTHRLQQPNTTTVLSYLLRKRAPIIAGIQNPQSFSEAEILKIAKNLGYVWWFLQREIELSQSESSEESSDEDIRDETGHIKNHQTPERPEVLQTQHMIVI